MTAGRRRALWRLAREMSRRVIPLAQERGFNGAEGGAIGWAKLGCARSKSRSTGSSRCPPIIWNGSLAHRFCAPAPRKPVITEAQMHRAAIQDKQVAILRRFSLGCGKGLSAVSTSTHR